MLKTCLPSASSSFASMDELRFCLPSILTLACNLKVEFSYALSNGVCTWKSRMCSGIARDQRHVTEDAAHAPEILILHIASVRTT